MNRKRNAPARIAIVVCILSCSGTGCERRRNEDYIPATNIAEGALQQALDAWVQAKPVGEVAGTQPLIFATDSNRKAGQTLRDYKILGETPGSSGRTYVVVLNLEHPTEAIKTTYIVVGIDPLWVFRQEDYELLMHWDHYMPAQLPAAQPPAQPQTAPPATAK